MARFLVAACVFHAVAVAVLWSLVRRMARERRVSWTAAMAGIAVTVTVGALAASTIVQPGFAFIRLMAQWLFGDVVLAVAWGTVLAVRRRAPRVAAACGLVAGALLAVYVEAYHLGPRRLVVERHVVERPSATPRALRVVHVSDVQASRIGVHERAALHRIAALEADVLVFTGDYLQPRVFPPERPDPDAFRAIVRATSRARLASVAVRGDTDGAGWTGLFAGTGVTTLHDSAARIPLAGGGSLAVIGLSPGLSRTRHPARLERLLAGVADADVIIMAGHAPDFVDSLPAGRRPDLVLAGHTHGGQIVLPVLGPPLTLSRLPRRHAGGLSYFEGVALHVSRGIGLERGPAPPIRFLCPPELCAIDLRLTGRR